MDNQLKLNEGETLELDLRPQPGLIMYNTLANAAGQIVGLLILAGYFVYQFYWKSNSNTEIVLSTSLLIKIVFVFVVIVLLILGIRWFVNSIKVGHLRYVFTDQRCIIYSGFIGINKQVIPYNRIADVDIIQGTMDAMFNISSVEIDEQAMNFGSVTLVKGLSRQDAEAITEVVSKHITKKQA